jgi:hypothetical protein
MYTYFIYIITENKMFVSNVAAAGREIFVSSQQQQQDQEQKGTIRSNMRAALTSLPATVAFEQLACLSKLCNNARFNDHDAANKMRTLNQREADGDATDIAPAPLRHAASGRCRAASRQLYGATTSAL